MCGLSYHTLKDLSCLLFSDRNLLGHLVSSILEGCYTVNNHLFNEKLYISSDLRMVLFSSVMCRICSAPSLQIILLLQISTSVPRAVVFLITQLQSFLFTELWVYFLNCGFISWKLYCPCFFYHATRQSLSDG